MSVRAPERVGGETLAPPVGASAARGAESSAPRGAESSAPRSFAGNRPEIYLQPGRVFATAEPSTVRTILGSCVSICLFDPAVPAGGMNHYLLPHRLGDLGESGRFGPPALAHLIAAMLDLGSRKHRLQAKVFGGACVLQPAASGVEDLGSKNVALAFDLLARESIPVIAHDVGGSRSRKLLYRTDDNAAFIRRL